MANFVIKNHGFCDGCGKIMKHKERCWSCIDEDVWYCKMCHRKMDGELGYDSESSFEGV